jgi:hypothetical protein
MVVDYCGECGGIFIKCLEVEEAEKWIFIKSTLQSEMKNLFEINPCENF